MATENETVSIKGLSKARVLAALFNGSRPLGLGALNPRAHEPMTEAQAEEVLAGDTRTRLYFDYLHGRVMKVDITGDDVEAWLYDRDNGKGAMARLIGRLRQGVEE